MRKGDEGRCIEGREMREGVLREMREGVVREMRESVVREGM